MLVPDLVNRESFTGPINQMLRIVTMSAVVVGMTFCVIAVAGAPDYFTSPDGVRWILGILFSVVCAGILWIMRAERNFGAIAVHSKHHTDWLERISTKFEEHEKEDTRKFEAVTKAHTDALSTLNATILTAISTGGRHR